MPAFPASPDVQLRNLGDDFTDPRMEPDTERRWDEAAGLRLDAVAYAAPQEQVNAAEKRGQAWAMRTLDPQQG